MLRAMLSICPVGATYHSLDITGDGSAGGQCGGEGCMSFPVFYSIIRYKNAALILKDYILEFIS